MAKMSAPLAEAIERGELTEEQFRELIETEARALGLTYDEAIARARAGTLPRHPRGANLELLVEMLDAGAAGHGRAVRR